MSILDGLDENGNPIQTVARNRQPLSEIDPYWFMPDATRPALPDPLPSDENARKTPIEAMELREGWWNPATPAAPGAAPGVAPTAGASRPTRQFMPMVSNLSAQDGRTVVGTSTPLARVLRSGQRR